MKDCDLGTIYARVKRGDMNRKFSMGLNVSKEEWGIYLQHKYRESTYLASLGINYSQFSMVLERVKHYFDTEYHEGNPASMIQKLKTDVLYGSIESQMNKREGCIYLDDYLYLYYEDIISGKRLKRGRGVMITKNHARQYRLARTYILEFQRSICLRYTLDDVDMVFRDNFTEWMKERGLRKNTICGILKNIQIVMLAAYEDSLTDNDIRRFHSFPIHDEQAENIILTEKQIETLCRLRFSTLEDIKKVITSNVTDEEERKECLKDVPSKSVKVLRESLDVFIVGLLTGQRHSDYSRIRSDMFTKVGKEWFIMLTQRKTGRKVYIPLDVRVKEIVDRYDGHLPSLCLTTINRNVRRICRFLGWNHDTGMKKTFGGKSMSSRFCDMVGSQSARRSFITNAYKAGVNIDSIMTVTGHFSERIFHKYVKMNAEDRGDVTYDDFKGYMNL